jgi:hypothetical protein
MPEVSIVPWSSSKPTTNLDFITKAFGTLDSDFSARFCGTLNFIKRGDAHVAKRGRDFPQVPSLWYSTLNAILYFLL